MDCVQRCNSELSQVQEWAFQFWVGRESTADDPRASRPVSMRNKQNVKKVDDLPATNRRISVRNISDTLRINCGTVCLIISCDLHTMKCVLVWCQNH